MYKKIVKIKGNKYIYYYHNFKIHGRVRNVCLGNNEEDALKRLQELTHEKIKEKIINNDWEIQKKINFSNLRRTLFLVFGLVIGLGLIYSLSPGITGFTVYNNNLASVNNLIVKFKIKGLLGLIIGLELMILSYNVIYKDHLSKKVI